MPQQVPEAFPGQRNKGGTTPQLAFRFRKTRLQRVDVSTIRRSSPLFNWKLANPACGLTARAAKCRLSSSRRCRRTLFPGFREGTLSLQSGFRRSPDLTSPNAQWSQGVRGPPQPQFQIWRARLANRIWQISWRRKSYMHHFVAAAASAGRTHHHPGQGSCPAHDPLVSHRCRHSVGRPAVFLQSDQCPTS